MADGLVPPGTTELGIDIIKVDRIRASLERFGDRFTRRVLTEPEQRYVRGRPETMAGRWAAKEAVSKVLGLGVRGIGWRDIEIERMPTGQPAVRLHGRAADRAEQLGMDRIAVSITHEFGLRRGRRLRRADGRRQLRLPARHRAAPRRARAPDPRPDRAAPVGGGGRRRRGRSRPTPRRRRRTTRRCPVPERGPVGFGRRDAVGPRSGSDCVRPVPGRSHQAR